MSINCCLTNSISLIFRVSEIYCERLIDLFLFIGSIGKLGGTTIVKFETNSLLSFSSLDSVVSDSICTKKSILNLLLIKSVLFFF